MPDGTFLQKHMTIILDVCNVHLHKCLHLIAQTDAENRGKERVQNYRKKQLHKFDVTIIIDTNNKIPIVTAGKEERKWVNMQRNRQS